MGFETSRDGDATYIQATITVFTDGEKERAVHGIEQFCRELKQRVEELYEGRRSSQSYP